MQETAKRFVLLRLLIGLVLVTLLLAYFSYLHGAEDFFDGDHLLERFHKDRCNRNVVKFLDLAAKKNHNVVIFSCCNYNIVITTYDFFFTMGSRNFTKL